MVSASSGVGTFYGIRPLQVDEGLLLSIWLDLLLFRIATGREEGSLISVNPG